MKDWLHQGHITELNRTKPADSTAPAKIKKQGNTKTRKPTQGHKQIHKLPIHISLVITLYVPAKQHGGATSKDVDPGAVLLHQSCTLRSEAVAALLWVDGGGALSTSIGLRHGVALLSVLVLSPESWTLKMVARVHLYRDE